MAKAKKAVAKKSPAKSKKQESTAWNAGQTMTLHRCKVSGGSKKENGEYRSIWEAYNVILGEKGAQESISQCVRVRKAIKLSKPMRQKVELSNGKTYTFEMVGR